MDGGHGSPNPLNLPGGGHDITNAGGANGPARIFFTYLFTSVSLEEPDVNYIILLERIM